MYLEVSTEYVLQWPLIQSVVNEVDRSLTRTTVLTKLKQKCQEDAQRPLPPINFGRIRAEERFGPAQQQTCVTRRIYNLTHSYVNEQLYVTGPAKLPKDLPRATLKRVWQKNHKLYQQELDQFIKGENVPRKRVVVSGREDYFGPRGRYARFITIQGRKYSTGRMSRDEFYQVASRLAFLHELTDTSHSQWICWLSLETTSRTNFGRHHSKLLLPASMQVISLGIYPLHLPSANSLLMVVRLDLRA